jgi:hypothetical protein
MSNDIFDALDTFIARFGRGNGQKSASAITTAKNRASAMHPKPQISAAFHQFWPFWPFRNRPMEMLRRENPKARINSSPARLACEVSILNGQKGQKAQNGPEARALPGFLPWPFARYAEFEKAKNSKIALEPASCVCHLAHGEGLPREVCQLPPAISGPAEEPSTLPTTSVSVSHTITPAKSPGAGAGVGRRAWHRLRFRQSQPIGIKGGDPCSSTSMLPRRSVRDELARWAHLGLGNRRPVLLPACGVGFACGEPFPQGHTSDPVGTKAR